MPIKNAAANIDDDLRPEYDLTTLKGGVRGKYYERATAGTTMVLLEPDVARAFPDGQTVNQALRALIKVAHAQVGVQEASGKLPSTRVQPTGASSKARTKAKVVNRRARG